MCESRWKWFHASLSFKAYSKPPPTRTETVDIATRKRITYHVSQAIQPVATSLQSSGWNLDDCFHLPKPQLFEMVSGKFWHSTGPDQLSSSSPFGSSRCHVLLPRLCEVRPAQASIPTNYRTPHILSTNFHRKRIQLSLLNRSCVWKSFWSSQLVHLRFRQEHMRLVTMTSLFFQLRACCKNSNILLMRS